MLDFWHNYSPNAIIFSGKGFSFHWYGLLIISGIALGLFLVVKLCEKYKFDKDIFFDLSFFVLIFGLIGDRLYYVFYAWEFYQHNLWDIFKIWQGGLAIHGGIIAGLITIFFYARGHRSRFEWLNFQKYKKEQFLKYFGFLLDLAVVVLLSGLMFGRWGNYFNQELFGRPTTLPWGIFIEEVNRPEEFINFSYFHPTFLYESLWVGIILVLVLIFHFVRIKKIKQEKKLTWLDYGNIFLLGLILFSLGRFFNEFLRLDYSPLVFGIRWAQIMSVFIILISFSILLTNIIKGKKEK